MTRKAKKEMQKNIAAVLIVVIFGVLVFSINAVGKFVAEKVIQPVMAHTSTEKDEKTITQTIKSDPVTVYALCAGNCKESAEAEELSKKIKEAGGAGVVYEDSSGFCSILACYSNKEWAQSVMEKNKNSFENLSVKELKGDEVSIKITATSSQCKVISESFDLIRTVVMQATELCIDTDKGDTTRLQACAKLKALQSQVNDQIDGLKKLDSKNDVIKCLKEMLTVIDTSLSSLPESSDDSFLQKLKECSAELTTEYISFYASLE